MYFCPLRLPNNIIDQRSIVNEVGNIDPNKFHMWKKWQGRTSIVSNEFHNLLDNLGCTIFFAELFYTPPNGTLEWHVDSENISSFIKINCVWGSNNHVMQWANPLVDINKPASTTTAGTKYLKFNKDEVEIVSETKILQPTLVNVGVPHRVKNLSNVGRWCLGLVLHKDHNRISFNNAVSLFNEYVQDAQQPLPHF